MAVLAKWIEQIAGGEPIEAVVIGPHDDDTFKGDGHVPFNAAPIGRPISWAEAKPFLSYEYDSGHGSADCHPVFAWTASKVIQISEYDGATGASWFPRHPIECEPEFDGLT